MTIDQERAERLLAVILDEVAVAGGSGEDGVEVFEPADDWLALIREFERLKKAAHD